ncbi:MAG: DNA-binding domain-containing protein [Paracoccaceae bacterium]
MVDAAGRAAGKRFDVYRNNVVVSLSEALATGFPVVRKLVGEAFFSAMAGVFVRAHPPRSPVLTMYGEGFPPSWKPSRRSRTCPISPTPPGSNMRSAWPITPPMPWRSRGRGCRIRASSRPG